jgi:hypothetical protein
MRLRAYSYHSNLARILPGRKDREVCLNDEGNSQELRSEMSLKPFNGWDYLLCAVAYFLIGIAAVPKIAVLLFGR